MYERYSDQARKVLYIARHEALTAGAPTVDVEHVLISLLQAETPAIRDLVENHGLHERIVGKEQAISALARASAGPEPESEIPAPQSDPFSSSVRQGSAKRKSQKPLLSSFSATKGRWCALI